ncbi:cellulase family glycosylhydrolase [Aggregatilineales bacterium SYSU G02658]
MRFPSDQFVLGVNYWPRRKAMYWWSNFDLAEVQEEFRLIADLGLNVVRIFLLWDDWQPTPDAVSADCLRHFGQVCDVAASYGLGLDVTFFTGHMSGPNWSPRWLLDDAAPPASPHIRQVISSGQIVPSLYRNMFHDPQALTASRLLLKTVVREYHNHDAIWMWNLGNEPDLFAHPHTAEAGRAWVREMVALIRSIDPEHPITCGLHVASLLEDNGLRVHDVYAETDVAVMHGYPMYIPWARHNLDPDFVPFTCALVSALCGKPCLAEEWGGCTAPAGRDSETWEWVSYGGQPRTQFMASERALAEYVEAVLPRLQQVGATGAMLWCFADYHESLWDRPPCDPHGATHERHFGLVRPDGTLKPHAEVIRRFAQAQPCVLPAERTVTLPISPAEYYTAPADYAQALYHTYCQIHNVS